MGNGYSCFLHDEQRSRRELRRLPRQKVFEEDAGQEIYPDQLDVEGFEAFIERYKKGLMIEQAAVDHLI